MTGADFIAGFFVIYLAASAQSPVAAQHPPVRPALIPYRARAVAVADICRIALYLPASPLPVSIIFFHYLLLSHWCNHSMHIHALLLSVCP